MKTYWDQRIRVLRLSFIFMLLLVNFGCKSSYFTNGENFSNVRKSYAKVLVVARTDSELAKRNFERKLVQSLKGQGVNAIASYELDYAKGKTKLNNQELDQLVSKLLMDGFDGAIITNMVHTEHYTEQVNSVRPYTRPMYYRRFRRYYFHYDAFAWDSTQLQTNTRYYLESALYNLRESQSDNLQWVGQFKISNPHKLEKVMDVYTNELTELLIENSISVD